MKLKKASLPKVNVKNIINKDTLMLIVSISLIPMLILSKEQVPFLSVIVAILIEIFDTKHISTMVLKPLTENNDKEAGMQNFWTIFAMRILLLLFFDFIGGQFIALVDLALIFVGHYLLLPFYKKLKNKGNKNVVLESQTLSGVVQVNSNAPAPIDNLDVSPTVNNINCAKPDAVIEREINQPNINGNLENQNSTTQAVKKIVVSPLSFDKIYSLPEEQMLEEFIRKEFNKIELNVKTKLMPPKVLRRRKIFKFFYRILWCLYLSSIFLHLPLLVYVLALIFLLIFNSLSKKYNLVKYAKAEIKKRPTEKIDNIVLGIKNSLVKDKHDVFFSLCSLVAILVPMVIFTTPRIIYEKLEDGYAVKYYIYGLKSFQKITVPEKYHGKEVVSINNSAFANLIFVKSIKLPDTITEIKSNAFANDFMLKNINIPSKLDYLGKNAFFGNLSLTKVKLPESLRKINNNTFKYCISLKNIAIPENTTKIGSSAFYGDKALNSVIISKDGKLETIDELAFSKCQSLKEITIPDWVEVSKTAFSGNSTKITYYSKPVEYALEKTKFKDSDYDSHNDYTFTSSIVNQTFNYQDEIVAITFKNSVFNNGKYTYNFTLETSENISSIEFASGEVYVYNDMAFEVITNDTNSIVVRIYVKEKK